MQLNTALRRRWIFLAFLLSLHLVFWLGPRQSLGHLMFLSHVGIGLLWQPFVQPRRRLGFVGIMLVVVFAALFSYSLSWPLLLLWAMLLTGVVGGKVFLFPNRWERLFHLLALGYLTTAILALVLPQSLAGLKIAEPMFDDLVLYLSPVLFLAMAALPEESEGAETHAEIVDYVYGVFIFLLLAAIVLGSLSFALLFKTSYFGALLVTLALVAGILMTLGFIWNPRAGFGGLGSAVAQHVMSLGLPIEDWLAALAELTRREEDPDRFLALACAELQQRMPGLLGMRWDGLGAHGFNGKEDGYRQTFVQGRLQVELWTRSDPSPAMTWHYDLMVRLLADYYFGKWRAQELRRLSYIEAIHETGARLTHDVKNLLQSLDTLCLAAEREGATPSRNFNELLLRQLPEIATRLRQTLAKLAAPGKSTVASAMPAKAWLESLRIRYLADWVEFAGEGDLSDCVIADPGMFSSIAENLLQNVADKNRVAPGVKAELRLGWGRSGPWLAVSDDGAALPDGVAAKLFAQRVNSESGLGVGLYQSARLAEEGGYRLRLAENRPGQVVFRLEPAD